ncbi:hypothetical protein ANRL3_00623 [Anaerolineae bacterium]|nr:hypothetical protein ANRL3_00623 [Anaerolineae bacterium]
MNSSTARFAQHVDLGDPPDNIVGEIIHGQLITHPYPAARRALAEPELLPQSRILVSDIAGWRRERRRALPKGA